MTSPRILGRQQPASAAPAGGQSSMPLIAPGQVYLTAAEHAEIKKYYPDWDGTQPIPGNIGELVRRAQQAARAEHDEVASPVPLDTPPLQMPRELAEHEIPAEKRREIAEAFQMAKQIHTMQQMVDQNSIANAPPGVNEAIAIGTMANPVNVAGGSPRQTLPEQPAVPRQPQPQPGWQPRQPTQPQPQHQHVSATGMGAVQLCVYCGWDQRQPDTIIITDEDKMAWVASIHLGQRFTKEFKFLDDSFVFRFRSLTVGEQMLGKRQCTIEINRDIKSGIMRAPLDTEQDAVFYRMCMSLCYLSTPGLGELHIDPLDQFQVEDRLKGEAGDTKLRGYVNTVMEYVVKTDDIRNLLMQGWTLFEATRTKLETLSGRKDFFRTAGAPTSSTKPV